MRAALALYALRFGGWLLAKAARGPVHLTLDVYSAPSSAEFGDFGDVFTLTRSYGWSVK